MVVEVLTGAAADGGNRVERERHHTVGINLASPSLKSAGSWLLLYGLAITNWWGSVSRR